MARPIFCIGSKASGPSEALPGVFQLRSVTRTEYAFRDNQGILNGNICLWVVLSLLVLALTW